MICGGAVEGSNQAGAIVTWKDTATSLDCAPAGSAGNSRSAAMTSDATTVTPCLIESSS